MRYVMVPVPSQFVMDVLRIVVFRAPDDDDVSGMRDEARLQHLMATADDPIRSLLLLVAKVTTNDDQLRFSDAADQLDVDGDALAAMLREVNRHALGGERELIGVSDEVAVRVHGNMGRNRYLVMRPAHARFVQSLQREADPRPT